MHPRQVTYNPRYIHEALEVSQLLNGCPVKSQYEEHGQFQFLLHIAPTPTPTPSPLSTDKAKGSLFNPL